MSLEEEHLPPSTQAQGGVFPTQRTAWDGGSLGSSQPGTYNTEEASMQEISGGDDYWTREVNNTMSMEEANEKLKEQLIAVRTEMMKYKHQLDTQLESLHTLDPCHDDGEVTRLKSELDIAGQRIGELEQEVLLNKYLQSPCPSMSSNIATAQNSGVDDNLQSELEQQGGELDRVRGELDGVKGELDRVKGERDRFKGELDKVKGEQDGVRGEQDGVNGERNSELEKVNEELDEVKSERNVFRQELDKVKGELGEVRGETSDLRCEVDKVRGELQITHAQLEQAKSELRSKEDELENVTKVTELDGASSHLHTIEELEVVKSTLETSLQDKQQELDDKQQELDDKQQELDDVRSTLQYREEELERVRQELESGKKTTPRKNRLDLQTITKLEEATKQLSEKEKKCEQFDAHIQKVEGEKSILENDLKGKREKLCEMEGQLEEAWSVSQTETQRRLELDSEWTRKRLNYQYELSEKSAKLEEAAVKYTRDLQRKEEREEELKQVVEEEKIARQGSETRLTMILEEKERIASEKEEIALEKERMALEKERIASEKEEVVKQNTLMLARINKVEEDRNELRTRALTAEDVCGGFQEEAEKTMEDYHKLAAQLGRVTEENGEIRQKSGKYFNELSKRTEEVKKQSKELKSKDEELKKKDDELMKKDDQVKNIKEQYEEKLKAQEGAAYQQMQLYEDDFAKEREAREKTITKLGEQHQLNGELRKRVENLERDKKELRVQLNQHAAQQFQAEFAEDYSNGGVPVYQPSSPRDHAAPIPRDPQRPQGPYRAS